MISIVVLLLGSLLSGVALFFSTTGDSYDVVLFILAFVLFFGIIDKSPTKKTLAWCIIVFISTYITLILSFLITISGKIGCELFIAIIPLTIYSSLLFTILAFNHYKKEAFVITWLISEYFFISLSIGNPLFRLSNILANFNVAGLLQIIGPNFASLLLLLGCFVLYKAVYVSTRYIYLCVFILLLLIIRSNDDNNSNDHSITVAAVSINNNEELVCLDSILFEKKNKKIDIIVMPEGVLRFNNPNICVDPHVTYLKRSLKDSLLKTMVIFGGSLYVSDSTKRNVSIAVNKSTHSIIRDKQILVPFGEYLPLKFYLSRFNVFNKINPYTYLSSKNNDLIVKYNGLNILPIICYEVLFINYLCDQINKGTNLITVNASNSYINSNHIECLTLNIVLLHSKVLNTSIIRSVDSGLSYIINLDGTVVVKNTNSNNIILGDIHVSNQRTFYCKNYVMIEFIYVLLLLFCLMSVCSLEQLKR